MVAQEGRKLGGSMMRPAIGLLKSVYVSTVSNFAPIDEAVRWGVQKKAEPQGVNTYS